MSRLGLAEVAWRPSHRFQVRNTVSAGLTYADDLLIKVVQVSPMTLGTGQSDIGRAHILERFDHDLRVLPSQGESGFPRGCTVH